MDLKKIFIREVGYKEWLGNRLANGVGYQKGFEYPYRRIGYGQIVLPIEYETFPEMFRDIGSKDSWIGGVRVYFADNKGYIDYSSEELFNKLSEVSVNKRRFLNSLDDADKISIRLRSSSQWRSPSHFYFRRNKCVSLDTVRAHPEDISRFSYEGFIDPAIFFVKADSMQRKPSLRGGLDICKSRLAIR